MTKNEIIEKLNALAENQEFADRAAMAATEEETIALLHEFGVDVTAEALNELMAVVPADANGELSEDALEDVSGGGLFSWLWNLSKKHGEDQFDWYWKKTHRR